MNDAPKGQTLPPGLRWLKGLVIVLTLTMIGGVITVVAVLVTRMPQSFGAAPIVPESLSLPAGTQAAAVTAGNGWFAVVTTDDRILIFGRSGELRQEVLIDPGLDR